MKIFVHQVADAASLASDFSFSFNHFRERQLRGCANETDDWHFHNEARYSVCKAEIDIDREGRERERERKRDRREAGDICD